MKIEKFEADGDRATFMLTGARSGIANALRRGINGSVAVLCNRQDHLLREHQRDVRRVHSPQDRPGADNHARPAATTRRTRYSSRSRRRGPATVYSKSLESADKEVEVANERIPIIKLGPGAEDKDRVQGGAGDGAEALQVPAGLRHLRGVRGRTASPSSVESFGQMGPAEMVNKAVAAIRDELKEVEKNAKKL